MTAARCDDGQMVWLPAVGLVRPGDILLTNNVESRAAKGLKVSGVIRAATRVRFSHTMICSSPPTFIEAVIAAQAAARAQFEVGRSYWVPRAVGSVLSGDAGRSADRGTFCSALVAQCYALAAAECFQRVSPERTTPATIEVMVVLEISPP